MMWLCVIDRGSNKQINRKYMQNMNASTKFLNNKISLNAYKKSSWWNEDYNQVRQAYNISFQWVGCHMRDEIFTCQQNVEEHKEL